MNASGGDTGEVPHDAVDPMRSAATLALVFLILVFRPLVPHPSGGARALA